LRIALAARNCRIEARALVRALAEKLELPLTETKLADHGRGSAEILAGDHADESCVVGFDHERLKAAVRPLWGIDVTGSDLPALEPCVPGDLPGSIRVAVSSNTGETSMAISAPANASWSIR